MARNPKSIGAASVKAQAARLVAESRARERGECDFGADFEAHEEARAQEMLAAMSEDERRRNEEATLALARMARSPRPAARDAGAPCDDAPRDHVTARPRERRAQSTRRTSATAGASDGSELPPAEAREAHGQQLRPAGGPRGARALLARVEVTR